MFTVKTVIFHEFGSREDTSLPLDEAFNYYLSHQTSMPSMAVVVDNETGEEFETFAKGWFVWDFTNKVWQLARVGLGAYGDGGPVNPAKASWQIEQRLLDSSWIWGIK